MIKESRAVLTAVENRKKKASEGSRSALTCHSSSGKGLAPLRQTGHLSLVKCETYRANTGGNESLTGSRRDENDLQSIGTSERSMPRHQHKQNRTSSYEDPKTGSIAAGEEAEVPNIKREFMLTPSADDVLSDTVRLLSRASGTSLSNSHFVRILLKAIAHAKPQLEDVSLQIGKLKRPSNAKESQPEREEYEQKLAAAVVTAIQAAPKLEVGAGNTRQGKVTGKRTA